MHGMKSIFYRSARIFEQEQTKLFRNRWVPLTVTQVTSGHNVPLRVGNEDIFLSKGHAYKNSCTHRLTRLVQSREPARSLVKCPYHNWCFKDGKLVKSPGYDGDKSCLSLPSVGNKRVGLVEMLCLNDDYVDKQEFSSFSSHSDKGDFTKYELVKTKEYDVAANWKHIVENFLDYLHVPTIHPELAPSSRRDDHFDEPSSGMHIAFKTEPLRKSKSNPLGLFFTAY